MLVLLRILAGIFCRVIASSNSITIYQFCRCVAAAINAILPVVFLFIDVTFCVT